MRKPRVTIAFLHSVLVGCLIPGAVAAGDSPVWQKAPIEEAARILEEGYIYKTKGHELATFLRSNAATYVDIEDKSDFAESVTADLYKIANDKHLRFKFARASEEEPTADERIKSVPPRRTYCQTASVEYETQGDVGYIRLPRFFGGETVITPFDRAISAMDDVDALVLDLRDNCGGGPELVKHVSTYFFDEPTHLVSTEARGMKTRERWTNETVPGKRFIDRPLYILTNNSTFSAAESFTFGMKVTGRALIVGERTGGGGHFGGLERISPDFTLFLPVGRTFDPRTKKGWEAEGIAPDVEASSSGALQAALDHFANH